MHVSVSVCTTKAFTPFLDNNESCILVYRVIAMMCVNWLGYGVHVCVRFPSRFDRPLAKWLCVLTSNFSKEEPESN